MTVVSHRDPLIPQGKSVRYASGFLSAFPDEIGVKDARTATKMSGHVKNPRNAERFIIGELVDAVGAAEPEVLRPIDRRALRRTLL